MTKTPPPLDDDRLDDFFAAAREATPGPSDALTARILADAADVQAGMSAPSATVIPLPLWRRMVQPIGGYAGAMGLAASVMLGVAAGYGTPETSEIWSVLGSSESFDFLAGSDGLLDGLEG